MADSGQDNLDAAELRFLQIAEDYTYLNPHLRLSAEWGEQRIEIAPTDPGWSKWRPSDPTSPHWYGPEEFERLLSACLTHDEDHRDGRLVREFINDFRGLTSSVKQKRVLDATGLACTKLAGLMNGRDLNHDQVERLLTVMKAETKAVKPAKLGIIGKEHLTKRFVDLGSDMRTFDYRKIEEVEEDVPAVIETAFAWRGDDCKEGRRLITGGNWSPGIVNPFRELGGAYGDGLTGLLERQYAGSDEPIVFLLHVACPRVRYTDRGKSAIAIE